MTALKDAIVEEFRRQHGRDPNPIEFAGAMAASGVSDSGAMASMVAFMESPEAHERSVTRTSLEPSWTLIGLLWGVLLGLILFT